MADIDTGERVFEAGPLKVTVTPDEGTITATVTQAAVVDAAGNVTTPAVSVTAPLTNEDVTHFRAALTGAQEYLLAVRNARAIADQVISGLTAAATTTADANPSA